MSNLLDRMLNIVGWDEKQSEVVEEEVIEPEVKTTSKRNHQRKIVNMHELNYNVNTLNVMQPESFEDARDVCRCLKANQPVIINLENISRDLAQRIVDFVSGAVYSLEGDIKKISAGIFIVTPNNYSVEENNNEAEATVEQEEEKSVLRWMN